MALTASGHIPAYDYNRVSTSVQASRGIGRKVQDEKRDECLAANPTWELVGSYKDIGSAWRSANSKDGELGKFLELVEKRIIPAGSVLIVYSLDRLSRDDLLYAQTQFNRILLSGIKICTSIDGMVFSTDLPPSELGDYAVDIVQLGRYGPGQEIDHDRT